MRSVAPSAPQPQAGPQPSPHGGAAGRTVLICSDGAASAAAWAGAIEDEGLTVTLRPLDDGPMVEPADALVLHVDSGVAGQLARLRQLRAARPRTPLVVVARSLRDLDQVLALEMGADDAFDAALAAPVVAARLRALWRRGSGAPEAEPPRELRFGNLALLRLERQALLEGRTLPLTEGEFEVLWLLASHAGQALSRREILRRVRGIDDHPTDRSIDSRVYRIRAKLGDHTPEGQRIRTVRNHGYAFSPVGW